MTTDMITLKLDHKFLKEIDSVVKKGNYQNRTEFIRASLRENVDKKKLQEAMMQLRPLLGSSKKKITEEEYERARAQAFEEIYKETVK